LATDNPIIVENDMYDVLDNAGFFSGWEAYIGLMPDSKDSTFDNCISVNSHSGIGVDTNVYQKPNFQILVRSDSYNDGREKAHEILDYLMNFDECEQLSLTVNGHHYALIFPFVTSPERLGRDERDRMLWALNFSTIAEHDDNVILDTGDEVMLDTGGYVMYGTNSEAIDG
jgi:hypothetical protein